MEKIMLLTDSHHPEESPLILFLNLLFPECEVEVSSGADHEDGHFGVAQGREKPPVPPNPGRGR